MNDRPQNARLVLTVDGDPALSAKARQKGGGILTMEIERSLFLNPQAAAIVILLVAHELVPDEFKPKCMSMVAALSQAELDANDGDPPF